MKVEATARKTKIALVVEYDGTRYHGSQFQTNAPTIQGELEAALLRLTGEKLRIKAASRTDAGVHARGQVVSFSTGTALPVRAFVAGLNHFLPADIAVKEAFRVADSFDARRGALSREYRYRILTSPTRSPLVRDHVCRVGGGLDAGEMHRACQALVGRHDFISFATAADIGQKSTVRQVHRASVAPEDGGLVLDMVANAFLPHQVRNTVGSLIRVGQGKMTADEFSRILEARRPGLAGPTAPAGGLCLMRVNYPDNLRREDS